MHLHRKTEGDARSLDCALIDGETRTGGGYPSLTDDPEVIGSPPLLAAEARPYCETGLSTKSSGSKPSPAGTLAIVSRIIS